MNKKKSLLVITGIYGFTILVSILLFRFINTGYVIFDALVVSVFATTIIFMFSAVFKNASIYDPYWSVAPMVLIFAFVDSINLVNLLFITVIYVWGIRLTLNWVKTFTNLHHQDWRYDYYRSKSKKLWPIVNYFGIHLMPTCVVFAAITPVYQGIISNGQVNAIVYFGFFIAFSAVFIQAVSDAQMHKHRFSHKKMVNQTGLWKYSRHPNYFGEILFWFGLFTMSVGLTFDIRWIIGPILMVFLFVAISIPLMERRQLNRRDGYAEYQKQTRMLLPVPKPIFPKNREAS